MPVVSLGITDNRRVVACFVLIAILTRLLLFPVTTLAAIAVILTTNLTLFSNLFPLHWCSLATVTARSVILSALCRTVTKNTTNYYD